MSWDLHPEEMIDKASSLPVTQTPEIGVFHNFMEGAAKVAMQGFAKTARAVDLLGAVGPIVEDWATDVQNRRALGSVPATMPKTVTAQTRYFKESDSLFQSAVDYWTPRPNEVGVAGEVAGSLLSMLPTIMASPALAVGATQLAQGQDLVREGVDPGKAQAVGAVQALGLGAGIWMPILGTNAFQRMVIGGAGFNVVQGVSTRAASKAILEGDKAAEQFRPLGGTELTLDILLGLAFGTMAHINPAQRAQGAKAWEDIGNFLKDSPPSDKAALATLREAQHINLDSLPGTPQTAADLDVHVQRMRAAIESLATDKPVDVENIVKDTTTPETVGDQGSPAVKDSLTVDQLPDAGNMVDVQTSNQPRYNPDLARIEQDTAIREAIQEHAKTVAAEEGIPQIPDRKTIAQTIEEQLVQAGRPAEEAKAGATLWQAFFDTTASRYGRTGQELFDRYMKGITGELTSEAMLAQKSLLDKMKDMQPQVESAKAAMDKIIQDQRELEGLRAAMRDPLTGKIYTGWSHQGAIATVPQWKPGMPTDGPEFGTWGRLNAEWDRGTDNTGFIDRDGKFISRTEAEKRWNVLTMEDVRDAKKKNGTLFQGAVPWYHSELDRQIGTAKMNSASPKDWKNYIKGLSNKGVKAEEVKWSGLEDWLDLQPGKVTKEQIQQFMKEGGVKVEETTLGGDSAKPYLTQENGKYQVRLEGGRLFGEYSDARDARSAMDRAMEDAKKSPKFATYQLPGGENYRELLLTLPRTPDVVRQLSDGTWAVQGKDGGEVLYGKTKEEAMERFQQSRSTGKEFQSSHFDQPNILSHIRFNERTDADGKKVLFIEEIQSDWAQKGKKEGFNVKPEIVEKKVGDRTVYQVISRGEVFSEETTRATAELVAAEENNHLNGVPSAPFVGKTEAWVGLSLKRMIRYAAENGFDRVAWTNGEQQAARYDLSKQIDRVDYYGDERLIAYGKDGSKVVDKRVPPGDLEEYIGKEAAKKLMDQPLAKVDDPVSQSMSVRDKRTLKNADLKVGGEGMKAFYDKIVPNVANDVLKKLGGGRVGEVKDLINGELSVGEYEGPMWTLPQLITKERTMNATAYMDQQIADVISAMRNDKMSFVDALKKFGSVALAELLGGKLNVDRTFVSQPGFDITPSMREKAMETQALFQPDRGALQFDQQGKMAIALLKSADPSTFLHESGHFFLEVTNDLASQPDAPAGMKQDMQTLYSWFGLKDADTWNNMTLDEKRPYHEQFARGFERYLRDGQAPTPVLKGLFQRFRDWLKAVYQSASQLNVEVSDQVRAVMDRMLAEPQRTEAPPEATRSATPPPPRGGVGEPMGEALVLTEVQQVREDIMAAEHTARQRWGDAIIDALYEKYAPHLEDAGQLRGMSAIMESLAEDAKPAYLMKTMGPRPKEPQSLIAAIKELGGIITSMRSDIAGPDKKGVPVSLFRKAGKNVDELALLLQEKGFLNEADIANESDNGGINKLMEMIQDEIGGNKHYSERDATQAAALREHDQFMESIDGKGESASTHFTPEEWATIQREVIAEGMAPTAKNVVDADAVSIAMQIDEARVERAAITAADDFDFMAEVREIIDGYKPQQDATAAERSAPPAAKPGTTSPAGQEANAPGADRNAGNQGVIAQQALRMVAENPDLPIATGVDAQGNTTYQKASEYLAEAKAMADLRRQDVSLFELAAQCLLGGGR